MVTDINESYCGDHFEKYTNIKSVYCPPEINVIYQLHLNNNIKT